MSLFSRIALYSALLVFAVGTAKPLIDIKYETGVVFNEVVRAKRRLAHLDEEWRTLNIQKIRLTNKATLGEGVSKKIGMHYPKQSEVIYLSAPQRSSRGKK